MLPQPLVLIPLFAALTQPARDPQDRFRFEVSADAVHLDVVVTTSEGRYVPGLTAEDFQIYEDGAQQTLSYFTSEVTPVTILLLLDVSASIRPSLQSIKGGAYRFLRGLQESDRMMIGFFNHDLWFTKDFTGDTSVLAREIQAMHYGGMTALYDAILASLEELSVVPGRRALVLFADGDDSRPAAEGSTASRADAIEGGRSSNVSIYTVGFQGRRVAGRGVNKGFLRRLAEESGGVAFFPTDSRALEKSFARIQGELHSQYRLAYTPDNLHRDGSWRNIEVRIEDGEHLHVRSRKGYYAPGKELSTDHR